MNTTSLPGNLKVNISSHYYESKFIPKQVELFDPALRRIKSLWATNDNADLNDLQEGPYVLRVSLPSGKQMDEIVHVVGGQTKQVGMDISSFSPHETHEWAYFTKNRNSVTDSNNFPESSMKEKDALKGLSAKLHTYKNNQWTEAIVPNMQNMMIFAEGETYDISVGKNMQVMEIYGPGIPSRFVCLPPSNSIKCLVKPSIGPAEDVHPLDITVSTSNWKAEAMLALLTSGDMSKAKSLMNPTEAEQLLSDKVVDPAGAAIGGYFLLKTDELPRLHDWARNLSNWFPWLPDGAIIYGWQLICEKDKLPDPIPMIRQQFIEAVKRGIPVYSVGLRKLVEGLVMLSYQFKQKDKVIERALAIVRKYSDTFDESQETTTFSVDGLTSHDIDENKLNVIAPATGEIKTEEEVNNKNELVTA